MQPVKTKWQNGGLVLVCERCYKERIPEEDPQTAAQIGNFDLRDWLKTRLKEDGHWGKVRAISTSCMDVCARRQVTVAIESQQPQAPAQVYVLDPLGDKEEFYSVIVKALALEA
ncbi:MAG: hypothetical protein M3N19_02220 [Candidatus Eremiobacteraeota bacterium]|nr:hypothetical protein [Candidatus Eremiobacteraeota bacterium]